MDYNSLYMSRYEVLPTQLEKLTVYRELRNEESPGMNKSFFERLYGKVTRKKCMGFEEEHCSNTRGRTLIALTATGVSNTIGSAVYVLTGFVIRYKAGPAIIVSYLIASLTTLYSALTYSELVGRISTQGSDYLYSYVTMGELWGFLVGWNLIMEYCVDVASVSKALTIHIDTIFFNKTVTEWQKSIINIEINHIGDYVDFFTVVFVLILTLIIAMGSRFSPTLNNMFTCFNLVCMVSIVVFGSFVAETDMWYLPKNETVHEKSQINQHNHNPDIVNGTTPVGFAPMGLNGILRGAGACIFAFAGFRGIMNDGQKSRNPRRNLPIASIVTLVIATVVYISVSFTISRMIPYYAIDPEAPLTTTFKNLNIRPIFQLLSVGAVTGLLQAAVSRFIPLPPLLTMMTKDGLLFKWLGEVDNETKGPFKGTVFYGIVIMILVGMFHLEELIDMLSIGTLIAYMMASIAVIRLRYKPIDPHARPFYDGQLVSNRATERRVKLALLVYIPTAVLLGLVIRYAYPQPAHSVFINNSTALFNRTIQAIPAENPALFITTTTLLSIILIVCGTLIYWQPQNIGNIPFKCPFVPIGPLASICVNSILMIHLSPATWIRISIWMSLGIIVYFSYSIRNSQLAVNTVSNRTINEVVLAKVKDVNNIVTKPKNRTTVRKDGYIATTPDSRDSRSSRVSRTRVSRVSELDERSARLFEWTAQLRAAEMAQEGK